MSVRQSTQFTAFCDACGSTLAFVPSAKEDIYEKLEADHHWCFREDGTVFCASCMKIYRTVALAIIPEAFEGKDGAACGLKA